MTDPISSHLQLTIPNKFGEKSGAIPPDWAARQIRDVAPSKDCLSQLAPDTELAKPYDILELRRWGFTFKEKLGQGTFGVVYKACITNADGFSGHFACKRMTAFRPQDYDSSEPLSYFIDYFKQELDATQILMANPHDNILQTNHIIRFYYPETRIPEPYNNFAFMELCDGNLKEFLEAFQPGKTTSYADIRGLPEDECKKLAWQLLSGLNFLHNAPKRREMNEEKKVLITIVHCDIKPENIFFVIRKNRVTFKLGDFGFVQVFEPNTPILSRRKAGTYFYYAPEMDKTHHWPIFQGYDPRVTSDIWAVGATIFVTRVGFGDGITKRLFILKALSWMAEGKWKDIESHFTSISKEMLNFLEDCCAYELKDRLRNVDEILKHDWLKDLQHDWLRDVPQFDVFNSILNNQQKLEEIYDKKPPPTTWPAK